jgi:hypothetical protein
MKTTVLRKVAALAVALLILPDIAAACVSSNISAVDIFRVSCTIVYF